MHKSRLGAIVIDCKSEDISQDSTFWGAALGSTPESGEGRRDPKYVRLEGAPGDTQVILQKVDHPSRVHIDIETDDVEAEVRRLQELGAKIVKKKSKWVVMEAPSKQRFCVIQPVRPDFEANANTWE